MEHLFTGTSELNLDEKGRLNIPVRHRVALEDGVFMTYGPEGCIWVLPVAKWEDVHRKAQGIHLPRNVERSLYAGESARPDPQGRLTIPAELRKHAGLPEKGASRATLTGAKERLEIWHPSRWQEITSRASQDGGAYDAYDEIRAQLGL